MLAAVLGACAVAEAPDVGAANDALRSVPTADPVLDPPGPISSATA